MSFSYEASGGFCLSSWAAFGYKKFYATKFSPRDSAWARHEAIKGVLEEIVIKKIDVINNGSTGGRPYFIYVDTLNSLWREDMLLTNSEAVILAANYYRQQVNKANEALRAANPNSCSN